MQTSSRSEIERAGHLVLPGVGAFGHCINRLQSLNLVDAIIAHAKSGRPMLGICVGMQLLMEYSEEFGRHEGFGLIPGSVNPIPNTTTSGEKLKIPHIGWNRIMSPALSDGWVKTPFEDTEQGAYLYFVHAFSAVVTHRENLLATTNYHDIPLTAAVRSGSTFGTQFHPEKSGRVGLNILRRFLMQRPV